MLDALDHYTWTTAYDYARLPGSKFFLEGSINGSKVIWINNLYAVYAEGTAKGFKINLAGRISVKIFTRRRILLMSSHMQ